MTTLFAGKYELEERLGEGAMGVVYRARHVLLDLELAVKVLHPQYAVDPVFRARFLREARLPHAFVHKRCVTLRDFGVDEQGTPYLTMDLAAGVPLARLIRENGGLSVARSISIAIQVLEVLEEAHAVGILHRDIKPDNIMVDPAVAQDQVKVMDFGIAKIMAGDPTEADLTRGSTIGTPLYMSPEQAAGERLDGRSDIYSMGVVLFEMLTGRPPFTAETVQALLMKHLTQPAPPVPVLEGGTPLLQEIVARALAKTADERFATALEFRQALALSLSGRDGMDATRVDRTVLAPVVDRESERTARSRREPPVAEIRSWQAVSGAPVPASPSAERDEHDEDEMLDSLSMVRPAGETLAPLSEHDSRQGGFGLSLAREAPGVSQERIAPPVPSRRLEPRAVAGAAAVEIASTSFLPFPADSLIEATPEAPAGETGARAEREEGGRASGEAQGQREASSPADPLRGDVAREAVSAAAPHVPMGDAAGGAAAIVPLLAATSASASIDTPSVAAVTPAPVPGSAASVVPVSDMSSSAAALEPLSSLAPELEPRTEDASAGTAPSAGVISGGAAAAPEAAEKVLERRPKRTRYEEARTQQVGPEELAEFMRGAQAAQAAQAAQNGPSAGKAEPLPPPVPPLPSRARLSAPAARDSSEEEADASSTYQPRRSLPGRVARTILLVGLLGGAVWAAGAYYLSQEPVPAEVRQALEERPDLERLLAQVPGLEALGPTPTASRPAGVTKVEPPVAPAATARPVRKTPRPTSSHSTSSTPARPAANSRPVIELSESEVLRYVRTPDILLKAPIPGNKDWARIGADDVYSADGYLITPLHLREGSNEMPLVGHDEAGSSITQRINLVLDTHAPKLKIDQPPEDALRAPTNRIMVTGKVDDEHLKEVRFHGTQVHLENNRFRFPFQLKAGQNELVLEAVDLADNLTRTTRIVTYQPK